jgi:hypothetical protein
MFPNKVLKTTLTTIILMTALMLGTIPVSAEDPIVYLQGTLYLDNIAVSSGNLVIVENLRTSTTWEIETNSNGAFSQNIGAGAQASDVFEITQDLLDNSAITYVSNIMLTNYEIQHQAIQINIHLITSNNDYFFQLTDGFRVENYNLDKPSTVSYSTNQFSGAEGLEIRWWWSEHLTNVITIGTYYGDHTGYGLTQYLQYHGYTHYTMNVYQENLLETTEKSLMNDPKEWSWDWYFYKFDSQHKDPVEKITIYNNKFDNGPLWRYSNPTPPLPEIKIDYIIHIHLSWAAEVYTVDFLGHDSLVPVWQITDSWDLYYYFDNVDDNR